MYPNHWKKCSCLHTQDMFSYTNSCDSFKCFLLYFKAPNIILKDSCGNKKCVLKPEPAINFEINRFIWNKNNNNTKEHSDTVGKETVTKSSCKCLANHPTANLSGSSTMQKSILIGPNKCLCPDNEKSTRTGNAARRYVYNFVKWR